MLRVGFEVRSLHALKHPEPLGIFCPDPGIIQEFQIIGRADELVNAVPGGDPRAFKHGHHLIPRADLHRPDPQPFLGGPSVIGLVFMGKIFLHHVGEGQIGWRVIMGFLLAGGVFVGIENGEGRQHPDPVRFPLLRAEGMNGSFLHPNGLIVDRELFPK